MPGNFFLWDKGCTLSISGAVVTLKGLSDHDPFDLDQQELRDDIRRVASQLASETDDADFVWLMSGPRGRRIARRLLDRAGIFRTSFHPNTMEMSRQEGAKQTGYWVLAQIDRLCPQEYTRMMQETRKDGRAVAGNRSESQD